MAKLDNSDDLSEWLKGKPKEYSQVIASRITLRTLPFLKPIFDIKIPNEIRSNIIVSIFRANLILWTASNYSTNQAILDASFDAEKAVKRAFVAVPKIKTVSSVILAAIHTTELITSAVSNSRAARYAMKADGEFYSIASKISLSVLKNKTKEISSVINSVTAYNSIVSGVSLAKNNDVNILKQGNNVLTLAKEPLWMNCEVEEFRTEWLKLKNVLLAQKQNWRVWINWYEDILVGRKPAGLSNNLAKKLYIKIATQENGWWEQNVIVLNAKITKWTDIARKEAKELEKQELEAEKYLLLAIDTVSPTPFINENNCLDVTSKTRINKPVPDEELHLLPERARRQISGLLKALERKNVSPILINALHNYFMELNRGFDFEITYLDDDMAIIRAERDADIDKIWCDAGIKAAINNLSEIHNKIQKHYPLDLEREEHIKRAPINPAKFDDEEYRRNLAQLVANTQIAFDEGKVTEEFLETVKRQQRQYNDIASLYPVPKVEVSEKDRIVPLDNSKEIKKRYLFQVGGFWGAVDKLHKLGGVAAVIGKLLKIFS